MNTSRSGKWFVFVIVWLLILGVGSGAYWWMFVRSSGPDGPGAWTGPGSKDGFLQVPIILWGGDIATFHANGGAETQKGTLFARQGLKIKLVRHKDDDFEEQVKAYLDGTSPFLRGTMSMLGQASEKIAKDDNTRPVVFLQMTWSAGDHLVVRDGLKTLEDLRGRKIALQRGGPHVGMLYDILATARLDWKRDVQIIWTDGISGDNAPPALFRKDTSIAACFAITPEMEELTGGLDSVGQRANPKNVAGARVMVSTAHMSRSIADVYACRKDYYDKHRDVVEKFAAAYLKGCEELVEMKRKNPRAPFQPDYQAVLKMTQEMLKDVPSDGDADGLVKDAVFVGLPGNRSFFTQKGNLSGFEYKLKAAREVAIANGDATRRYDFLTPGFDYNKIKELGQLTGQARKRVFDPKIEFVKDGTIYSFNIYFKGKQATFTADEYGDDFQRALEQASLFGNAALLLKGHTDAISVLGMFCETGTEKKTLTTEGDPIDWIEIGRKVPIYAACQLNDGTRFDLQNDREIVAKIFDLVKRDSAGNYGVVGKQLKKMQELSQERADSVRKAIQEYARDQDIRLEITQIRAEGVGALRPVAPADKDTTKNRRVEFSIARVLNVSADDFDD